MWGLIFCPLGRPLALLASWGEGTMVVIEEPGDLHRGCSRRTDPLALGSLLLGPSALALPRTLGLLASRARCVCVCGGGHLFSHSVFSTTAKGASSTPLSPSLPASQRTSRVR